MPDVIERWSAFATRVLAPNPGPMTLDGTNTYVVALPGSDSVAIVDPGPSDPRHLERLLSLGEVSQILLTHRHADHSESAAQLAARTGASVRAADASLCVNASPLTDGDVLVVAGVMVRVIATPGHTSDSVCFHLPDDRFNQEELPRGSVMTGDTILGAGTTAIAAPDGKLADYLNSLRKLGEMGNAAVLPGHGPYRESLPTIADDYLRHRSARLREVEAAVNSLLVSRPASPVTVEAVTDLVYRDVPSSVRVAAEMSVAAQLTYLAARREGNFATHRLEA